MAARLLLVHLLIHFLIAGNASAQPAGTNPQTAVPGSALFIDDASISAASVSPRNLPISEKVVTAAGAGGQITPVVKVVNINSDLLASAPSRIPLNLPGGVTITAIRRRDHDRLARTALAAPMAQKNQQQQQQQQQQQAEEGADGAAIWVGEVVGQRRGLSSVVLVASEGGGLYGNVRYLDRKTGSINTFAIYPMLLEGADPVAAAAMAGDTPTAAASSDGQQSKIALADLYPARHPTKHIVVQYEEGQPSPLSPEEEERVVYRGPPEAANANPATVATAPPGEPAAVPLPPPGVTPPTYVAALAATIAAGAGPDIAAELGPAGFAAAASSWIERSQAAAAAPAAALAAVDNGAATDSLSSSARGSSSSTVTGTITEQGTGRRLKQSVVFNERQDVLMLWTDYAASRVTGGATRIQELMRIAVVTTNQIYADSRASIDLILVGMQRTSHTNNNCDGNNLDSMRIGNVQGLTAARDTLGADFVQMWVGTTASSGTCGIGYVPGSMTGTSAVPPLLSIVNNICFDGLTVAHEIGHNQGCFHSASDTGSSIADYAAGYAVCGSFHTVMAYQCSRSTRLAFLSNPNINRPGTTTKLGNLQTAHCARRVSETAAACAAARAEKFPSASGSIRSALSAAKCLDVVSYAQGTQTAINDCVTGRSHQRWEVLPGGSLRSPNTARCLQAASAVTNGVSNVNVWECTAALPAQQWFYDTLTRLHPYSSPSRCLTLPGSNTNKGQGLTVEECSSTANNQRWTTSSTLFPPAFNPQNSRLQSLLATPAQCIENLGYNTTNGAPVGMMPCNANATTNTNQRWRLSDTGQLQLTFNTAKCLEAGPAGANGDPIRLSDCTTSSSNQRWFMDASSRLRPYHAPAKCMDIRNGATVTPAVLQLFDCLEANQQKWTVLA